jgi:hypothetical protein
LSVAQFTLSKATGHSLALYFPMKSLFNTTTIGLFLTKKYSRNGNVFFEKSFTYNSIGKLVSENTKTYYDSTTEKLEIVHYAIIYKKKSVYNDTITNIKYYRNNVLQSTEEVIAFKNGKVS